MTMKFKRMVFILWVIYEKYMLLQILVRNFIFIAEIFLKTSIKIVRLNGNSFIEFSEKYFDSFITLWITSPLNYGYLFKGGKRFCKYIVFSFYPSNHNCFFPPNNGDKSKMNLYILSSDIITLKAKYLMLKNFIRDITSIAKNN